MSERWRLPNRRRCESFNFELGGLRFAASIGRLKNHHAHQTTAPKTTITLGHLFERDRRVLSDMGMLLE